jgi:hypothetical protein
MKMELVLLSVLVVIVVLWRMNSPTGSKKDQDLKLLNQAISCRRLSSVSHPAVRQETIEKLRSQSDANISILAEKYGVELDEWKPFPNAAREIYEKITGEPFPEDYNLY